MVFDCKYLNIISIWYVVNFIRMYGMGIMYMIINFVY